MRPTYPIVATLALAAMLGANPHALATLSDQDIESAAKDSYVFKNYLKDDSIKIESKDGAVTLTGTVANEAHQSLAQETVAGLPGVKSVDNKLKIQGDTSAKDSDAWLSTKVKTALLFHRDVSARNTKVEAKDGIVTLKGRADSQAQKDLTTEYAKEVEGVRDAVNEMRVSRKPKRAETWSEAIDDASITAQVKMALLFHGSTSALDTKVQTNQGVVMLTGEARSSAEKDLVTKLVSDIKGVKSVTNEMTVAP